MTTNFCRHCPMSLSHYVPIPYKEVPEDVLRFDAPPGYRGQAVEYAFSATGAGEGDIGDEYMRRTDRSVSPAEVTYYRHCGRARRK